MPGWDFMNSPLIPVFESPMGYLSNIEIGKIFIYNYCNF